MKNANIKSTEELERRLREGEVFYHNDNKIYYDFSYVLNGKSPYRFEAKALNIYWGHFKYFTINSTWEDSLADGPIPCWVSDIDSAERDHIALIKRPDKADYCDRFDTPWKYATPIKPSDCYKPD